MGGVFRSGTSPLGRATWAPHLLIPARRASIFLRMKARFRSARTVRPQAVCFTYSRFLVVAPFWDTPNEDDIPSLFSVRDGSPPLSSQSPSARGAGFRPRLGPPSNLTAVNKRGRGQKGSHAHPKSIASTQTSATRRVPVPATATMRPRRVSVGQLSSPASPKVPARITQPSPPSPIASSSGPVVTRPGPNPVTPKVRSNLLP